MKGIKCTLCIESYSICSDKEYFSQKYFFYLNRNTRIFVASNSLMQSVIRMSDLRLNAEWRGGKEEENIISMGTRLCQRLACHCHAILQSWFYQTCISPNISNVPVPTSPDMYVRLKNIFQGLKNFRKERPQKID